MKPIKDVILVGIHVAGVYWLWLRLTATNQIQQSFFAEDVRSNW